MVDSQKLLARIRKHGQADELRSIAVPEWGEAGEPLVIHFRPVTVADYAQVSAIESNPMRFGVRMIVHKGLDAQGGRLFNLADALELMETADPAVIMRVSNAMNERVTREQAEKN